jgi:hypothetical protein
MDRERVREKKAWQGNIRSKFSDDYIKKINRKYPVSILIYESGDQRRSAVCRYKFGDRKHVDDI